MNKEQILQRLDELKKESDEIAAEQKAIHYLLTVVCSEDSSCADEVAHIVERRQNALNRRIIRLNYEFAELDKEIDRLEKAA